MHGCWYIHTYVTYMNDNGQSNYAQKIVVNSYLLVQSSNVFMFLYVN